MLLVALFLFSDCSSSKKNFFSKTYHNTTAYFNAYFIAKEELREIDELIAQSHHNDYNKILSVFYDIDSITIDGVRDKLEDIIKKASLPIQRHGNSKWVYPSYYLIGMARYYGGDFENAIKTFKYINKNSEDKDLRHQALIALMRTFIDYNEKNNAIAVADYLRKEKLSKENEKDFLLVKTYFFQLAEDYKNMVPNLSKAVELEKDKKKRARYHFILGQVYQYLGFEGEAYNHYKRCLKSSPEYELSFFAKLNMAEVIRLDQKVDLKKIRGYFSKLLKDEKNKEFVDRIYYEMAKFEIKHNNHDQAVEYLKSSVTTGIENPRQKGYSYLKLGELYYDHYKDYRLAQAYYDSAVMTLPQDEEGFEKIKERADILKDFVVQIETIKEQDSLLTLADMDRDELQKLLEEVVAERERKEREQEREAKKLARRNATISNNAGGQVFANPFGIDQSNAQQGGGTWYFYNLAAVSSGRSQFLARWGNRPLEDNWRRSQKKSIPAFAPDELANASDTTAVETEEQQQESVSLDDRVAAMIETIPFSDEAKATALKKIEDAYFKLGNIYNFQLEETDNAINTFEKLLSRFPGSEHEPEALYLLYLMYKERDDEKAETFKQQLIDTYPQTLFAKLAINPNYREESNETAERLKKLYEIAYDYYRQENYSQAKTLVNRAIELYPENSFTDKLRILGILIDGKVEGQTRYQFELQEFIKNYPESPMLDYAKSLLEASKNFKKKELQRKGARYITYFDQPHFFVLVYPNLGEITNLIPSLIDNYIEKKYANRNLKTGNLSLNEGFSIVLVNKFQTKDEAMKFYEDFNKSSVKLPESANIQYENFVITEDNFQIFYQARNVAGYLKFFKEYYKP